MNNAILTQHLSGLFLENFFLLLSLNGEKEKQVIHTVTVWDVCSDFVVLFCFYFLIWSMTLT